MVKAPQSKNDLPPAHRLGVYLLVSIYFSIAVITLLPKSPLESRLIALVSPLTQALNLSQNWKLFSPDLREINFCSHAVVEFADGTTKLYEFPRLEQMSTFDAYRRQKLCKLFQDSMPWPDFSLFWPDVGRFIARANFERSDLANQSDSASNLPVQVSLSYNWVPVSDMDHFEKQSDLKEPNRRFTFFVYRVKPEDLK
ncbi:MAG: hypothetical protein IT342_15170 [Candidatus Melainabacteria bacterium]|nr:hypothetical protein [Candidatus Melainabacteria bacterium]